MIGRSRQSMRGVARCIDGARNPRLGHGRMRSQVQFQALSPVVKPIAVPPGEMRYCRLNLRTVLIKAAISQQYVDLDGTAKPDRSSHRRSIIVDGGDAMQRQSEGDNRLVSRAVPRHWS